MLKAWFHRVVLSRRWLTFLVMVASFFAFGIGTLNLFYLLRANGNLLLENGWQAVMDGGAQQLVELLVNGVVGMAAYIVFKACEYRLVHGLIDTPDSH
ncbi:hypothetical protein [Aquabacterium sp.]|uniref:hypothetical protein n=1 Tax=Aquabacterium sp. TaxID=1872578 RepID=UPI00378437EC